jgi:hypothetical protein
MPENDSNNSNSANGENKKPAIETVSIWANYYREISAVVISVVPAVYVFFKNQKAPENHYVGFSLIVEVINIIVLLAGFILFSRKYTFEPPRDPEDFQDLVEIQNYLEEKVKKTAPENDNGPRSN